MKRFGGRLRKPKVSASGNGLFLWRPDSTDVSSQIVLPFCRCAKRPSKVSPPENLQNCWAPTRTESCPLAEMAHFCRLTISPKGSVSQVTGDTSPVGRSRERHGIAVGVQPAPTTVGGGRRTHRGTPSEPHAREPRESHEGALTGPCGGDGGVTAQSPEGPQEGSKNGPRWLQEGTENDC